MKKLLVLALVLALVASVVPVNAYAWEHHRGCRGWGPWGWFGIGAASALVAGAVIASLPPRVTPVVVGPNTYYTDGVNYYVATPQGYMVVANPNIQPVIVQPQPQVVYVQPQPQTVYVQSPQVERVIVREERKEERHEDKK